MIPDEIKSCAARVESMTDAMLGSFIVKSMKEVDRPQYESLLAYLRQQPSFINSLNEINDQINFGLLEKITRGMA